MYKDYRYINAGTIEIYRYGHKARELAASYLTPNEEGFYSIPADAGKYWTIGTNNGKYGEFTKYGDTFLSVNSIGRVWAKVGTPKAEVFVEMVNAIIAEMKRLDEARCSHNNDDDEEEE